MDMYTIPIEIFYWTLTYNVLIYLFRPIINEKINRYFVLVIISLLNSIYLSIYTTYLMYCFELDYKNNEYNILYVQYPKFEDPIKSIMAYLIFDLVNMLMQKNTKDLDMIFHHVYNLLICSICLYYNCAQWIVMFCLFNEYSTIPLSLWRIFSILKKENIHYFDKLIIPTNILFVISFFACRTFLLTYVIYLLYPIVATLPNEVNHLHVLIILFMCHYGLNIYWTVQIILKILDVLINMLIVNNVM